MGSADPGPPLTADLGKEMTGLHEFNGALALSLLLIRGVHGESEEGRKSLISLLATIL